MPTLTLQINGQARTAKVRWGTTLLEFLHDHLEMTGTRAGCEEGLCGACTVLVDGRATRSCMVTAESIAGHQVTTIEGLADGPRLHPVQQAFLEFKPFECGFCTPAMILAAAALLAENPEPDDARIRGRLAGNECRCGQLPRIVEAVRLAARLTRAQGEAPSGNQPG